MSNKSQDFWKSAAERDARRAAGHRGGPLRIPPPTTPPRTPGPQKGTGEVVSSQANGTAEDGRSSALKPPDFISLPIIRFNLADF